MWEHLSCSICDSSKNNDELNDDVEKAEREVLDLMAIGVEVEGRC